MKIDNLFGFFILVIFLMPIFLAYNLVFYLGMDFAVDRDNYLLLMSNPSFSMREEPLIILLSKALWFIYDPKVKLLLIQNFFNIIVFVSIYCSLNTSSYRGVLSTFLFLLYTLVFSVALNIQIRIGYAISIFLFLFFVLKYKINFKNIILYCLPIFMHMGIFFLISFLYLFKYLNLNNLTKVFVFNLLYFLLIFFLFVKLSSLLAFLGFDAYYLGYVDSNSELSTTISVIPNSVLIYIFLTIVLLIIKREREDYLFWVCFSAYGLIFAAFFLKISVLYKFLMPLSAFVFLYFVRYFFNRYKFSNFDFFYLFLLNIILSFVMLYFFSEQANIMWNLFI